MSRRRNRSGLKPCSRNEIRNPKTNRCVNRSGEIGKKILQRKRKQRSAGGRSRRTPCSRNQIRNPKTNRCVNRSGEIGKKILQQRRKKDNYISRRLNKVYTKNINSKVEKLYGNALFKIVGNDTEFLEIIKPGAYGKIYKARSKSTQEPFIIKIEKHDKREGTQDMFIKKQTLEFDLQKNLNQDVGIPTPQVYWIDFFKHKNSLYSVIKMSKLSMITLGKVLQTRQSDQFLNNIFAFIYALIDTLCAHNYVHGDWHWENFSLEKAQRGDNFAFEFIDEDVAPYYLTKKLMYPQPQVQYLQPVLLDFGMAANLPCNPQLEILQLLRTLDPELTDPGDKPYDKYNVKVLTGMLLHLYEHDFGIAAVQAITTKNGRISYSKLDKIHEKVWEKHMARREKFLR